MLVNIFSARSAWKLAVSVTATLCLMLATTPVQARAASVPYFDGFQSTESDTTDQVVTVAAIAPEFDGGMAGLFDYLSSSINYPNAAKKLGTEGTVFVAFVVEKDGSLSGLEVRKGVNAEKGDLLDKEAMRIVKKMPKWKPGKDAGQNPVRVSYMLPVRFKID